MKNGANHVSHFFCAVALVSLYLRVYPCERYHFLYPRFMIIFKIIVFLNIPCWLFMLPLVLQLTVLQWRIRPYFVIPVKVNRGVIVFAL